MLAQERVHLSTFDKILRVNQIRPTLMRPVWHVAGALLGAGTAMLGKEGAMMCTEAVETVIGEHYNDQLRELRQELGDEQMAEFKELRQIIQKFRDEELEHLDHAVLNDSKKAPMHGPLSELIKFGCRGAIWISSRV